LDTKKQILPVARYLMGGVGIWKENLSFERQNERKSGEERGGSKE